MKIIKKMLIGALIASVVFACLSTVSLAAVTAENLDDVLEYYSTEVYENRTFEDGVVPDYAEFGTGSNNATTTVVDGNGGKMLNVIYPIGSGSRNLSYLVEFDGSGADANAAPKSVCMEFDINSYKLENTDPAQATAYEKVNYSDGGCMAVRLSNGAKLNTFFQFDLYANNNHSIKYLTTGGTVVYPEFVPAPNTWYHISIVTTDSLYSFKVTDATGKVCASMDNVAYDLGGNLTSATFFFPNSMNKFASTSLDNLRVYEGTYLRDFDDTENTVGKAIQDLIAFYKAPTTTTDLQLKTLKTIGDVVKNYQTTNPDYLAAISTYEEEAPKLYAGAFIKSVNDIDVNSTYKNRTDVWTTMNDYYQYVPEGSTEAGLAEAKLAYDTETAALEKIRTDGDAFIAAVTGLDTENGNYATLNTAVTEADKYSLYISYPGAEEAKATYDAAKSRRDTLKTAADAFISYVDTMESSADHFGVRQENYVLATDNYFEDESYDGVTEAIATYNSLKPEILEKVAYAEEFLEIMDQASFTDYYNAKQEYIAQAEVYIEAKEGEALKLEREYTGVAEAEKTYNDIKKMLDEKKVAADAYIAAVNEIASATTYAEKQTAVDHALALKEAGDTAGITGVKEANIVLSNAEAEVKLASGYSKKLVNAVNALKDAKTLTERYSLIVEAEGCLDNAEPTFDGVNAAKTALAAAKTQYDADVTAANNSFSSVRETANEVIVATAPAEKIGKIVAVIKKFF